MKFFIYGEQSHCSGIGFRCVSATEKTREMGLLNAMSIWDKFPNLNDSELRTLVATATRVMLDSEDARSKLPPDFLDISTIAASRELVSLLPGIKAAHAQVIQHLLEDEDSSKAISLAILKEVQKHPELAERVAKAYEERTQKMTGVELVLLSGALVVLAIKIKKIRWTKDGVVIGFAESGDVVKSFLAELVKNMMGG
jgi:hypothetical protein